MPVTPTDLPASADRSDTLSSGLKIIEFSGTGTTVATAMTGSSFCCP